MRVLQISHERGGKLRGDGRGSCVCAAFANAKVITLKEAALVLDVFVETSQARGELQFFLPSACLCVDGCCFFALCFSWDTASDAINHLTNMQVSR